MSPILSALLSLGLCLGQRMRSEADTLPRPSLRAENSSLVPQGRSVTLRCQGPGEAVTYFLEKVLSGRTETMDVKASGIEGEFPIPSVTAQHAGTYYCFYRHSSDQSEFSEPLELVVTGLYDPPSLSAQPSPEVASGHNVTLLCQSQRGYNRYALYKDGEEIKQGMAQPQGRGTQATFHISAVTSAHRGTYQCYSFQKHIPNEWSSPSNAMELRVTGNFSPSPESGNTQFDPAPQDYTVGNIIHLSLAGLVLFLLGVLLADAWHSSRTP